MIKYLSGIHETVDFAVGSQVNLYENNEAENYPPHWHAPFELIMPLENTYQAACGGQTYSLREGDILIICPGILHELFAPAWGRRIIFQPGLSGISIRELDSLISLISPALLLTPEEYPQIHEKMRETMLEIRDEYFSGNPYSEVCILARFLSLLTEAARGHSIHAGAEGAPEGKQKEYIAKFLSVTEYIGHHFTEDLHLEDMANWAGFSKYHFSRLFRQYTDSSFYRYLNQQRIAYAKTLLLNPELSVLEVALQSGFSSPSAFLRMFRQLNGCTPTQFRALHRR